MAAYSEIQVEKYTDFEITLNVRDIQGDAMNLSNYAVTSQFRKTPYTSVHYTFNTGITGVPGEIVLSMPSANTANVPPGRYMYDVVITSNTNIKTRVVEGIVTVTPGATF